MVVMLLTTSSCVNFTVLFHCWIYLSIIIRTHIFQLPWVFDRSPHDPLSLKHHVASLHSWFDSTHHVPQPEIPIVWMRAKTHWRKKMKKKAIKLNELSALWTTWKKRACKKGDTLENKYFCCNVASSYWLSTCGSNWQQTHSETFCIQLHKPWKS